MSATPLMGLVLPVPLSTLGPAYASEINVAFTTLDAHNHAPGSGAQLGAAAFNIDADLSLNGFNLVSGRMLRLSDQTSISLSSLDLRGLYVKSGDLYYVNASGTEVQVTVGNSVAGANGSITGLTSPASASFASGTFTFKKDASNLAKFSISDLSIYNGTDPSKFVTVKASTGAAGYSLTLPDTIASQANGVSSDSSGNLIYGMASGTASTPGLTFNQALGTGFYLTSGIFGLSIASVTAMTVSSTGTSFTGTVTAPPGGASNPSYGFTGSSFANGTGVFFASNSLRMSVNGGTEIILDGSTFSSLHPQRIVDGTIGTPAIAFTNQPNLGLYRSGNDVRVAFGSADVFTAGPTGVSTGNGVIKWRIYTGSLGASLAITLAPTGATQLMGVVGWSNANPMVYSTSGSDCYFARMTTDTAVQVVNGFSGGSSTYRVTVFYV